MKTKMILAAVLVLTFTGCADSGQGIDESPAGMSPTVTDSKPSLALLGYDVVAYHRDGIESRGSDEFSYKYLNQIWLFSNELNRSLFEDNPERYLPFFGEYCANGLSDRHVITASPIHWLINDDRLFLFYSRRGLLTWVNGNLNKEFAEAEEYYIEQFGASPRPGEPTGYRNSLNL